MSESSAGTLGKQDKGYPGSVSMNRLLTVLMVGLWGGLLSAWVLRPFFIFSPGEFHDNHEFYFYLYRQVEFRDCIASGNLSPQWFTNARGGLGSPVFSYYQPGLFYAATMTRITRPDHALGVALWLFSMLGYVGMVCLVRRSFDLISGLISGTLLVLSVYGSTNIYIRGDLSEFAAMMLLPAILNSLIAWLESKNSLHLLLFILLSGGLVITHPCVALPGFGFFAVVILVHGGFKRRWKRSAGGLLGLLLAGLLAAFYWLPVVRELDQVQAENALAGPYNYAANFIQPHELKRLYRREMAVPFTLGVLPIALLFVNGLLLNMKRNLLSPAQRRLLATLAIVSVLCVFMMTAASRIVWDLVAPLQRVQFPWRMLSMLTVTTAAFCGPVFLFLSAGRRRNAMVVILALAFLLSFRYTRIDSTINYIPVERAADIADAEFFEPDAADEWLPRGATDEFADKPPTNPFTSTGITASAFQRTSGFLVCKIDAENTGSVTLPNYNFIGWKATLNGIPVAMDSNEDGLMQIKLKQGDQGDLEIRFAATPARRTGWRVSLFALVATLLFVFGILRMQKQSSNDTGYERNAT